MNIINAIKNILLILVILIIFYTIGLFIYAHYNINSIKLIPPKIAYEPSCTKDFSLKYDENKEIVKVLFISGGGISGIIPLSYLSYIEKKSKKSTHDLFDIFSGTSTGSIIVSGLNAPHANFKKPMSANNLLNIYIEFANEAMNSDFYRRFFTLDGLLGPVFDIRHLHAKLAEILGKKTFYKMMNKPIFLSTFNMNTSKIEFFNQASCLHEMRYGDFYLADILTATCAAPSIFSSASIYNPRSKQEISYIDAGIISNNSFPYLFEKIIKMYPHAKKYIFVYLDTGNFHIRSMKLKSKNYNRWGYLEWAEPLIRMLFEAQVKHIHQGIINLLHYFPTNKIDYYYFSTDSRGNSFDTSSANIQFILKDAEKNVQKNKARLDHLIKELEQN